ncbi:MAG: PilZ domain-containing protein [Sedimentisphaerales bacterium]|nr:PilZ domain-containing protein [Sedimentisphaerales bacterium]
MTDNKPFVQQKERRQSTRRQIPKAVNTKVIVSPQQLAGDSKEDYWEGCLYNICELGAQIILEEACWEQLLPNQMVKLQLEISSSETNIKAEMIGQVVYILSGEQDRSIKLRVKFLESELNTDTKRLIPQACEAIAYCHASEFGECPNL